MTESRLNVSSSLLDAVVLLEAILLCPPMLGIWLLDLKPDTQAPVPKDRLMPIVVSCALFLSAIWENPGDSPQRLEKSLRLDPFSGSHHCLSSLAFGGNLCLWSVEALCSYGEQPKAGPEMSKEP